MRVIKLTEASTIYNEDCFDVFPHIESSGVNLVLVDVPYGTTRCKWDVLIPFDPMWNHIKRVVKPNGAIVMTSSQPFTSLLICSNLKMYRYNWVWDKIKGTGHLNAQKIPMKCHEDVCVFYKKPPTFNPQKTSGHVRKTSHRRAHLQSDVYGKTTKDTFYDSTERFPRTIQRISCDTQRSALHSTQKPVALMEYMIKTYSNKGDTVLDFAMGSGTTGIACKNLDRKFVGIEKDIDIFEIAHNRIGNHVVQMNLELKPLCECQDPRTVFNGTRNLWTCDCCGKIVNEDK